MLRTLTTFTLPEQRGTFERLRRKAIADALYIDDTTLQHFGLYEEVHRYLAVGHIHRLFAIRDPAYHPVTMEFLSTLHIDIPSRELPWTLPTSISFRIGGVSFQLRMEEFCLALGLYTSEEIEDPAFGQLRFAVHSFDYIALWREYSFDTAPYDPHRSKAAKLRSYAMRYLQRVMARSFLDGGRAAGVLGYSEFFYIQCMMAEIPMHLGHSLLRFLFSQSIRRQAGPSIGGGPYITRLFFGLHMTHTIPRYLRPEGSWSPLGVSTFTSILCRQPRDREFLSQFPVDADRLPDQQTPPTARRRRAPPPTPARELFPVSPSRAPSPPPVSTPPLEEPTEPTAPAESLAPPPSSAPPPPSAPSTDAHAEWRQSITQEVRRLADEQQQMRQTMDSMYRAMQAIMAHFEIVVPGPATPVIPSPSDATVAQPTPVREASEDSIDRLLRDDGASTAAQPTPVREESPDSLDRLLGDERDDAPAP